MPQKNSDKIYNLAKKIDYMENSNINNQNKNNLYNKLSMLIFNCFEKQEAEHISEAIIKAVNLKENSVVQTLLTETYLEIENIAAKDESGKEINSSFLLMPVIVHSKNSRTKTPTINNFQKSVSENLVKNGIITSVENFYIGTTKLNGNVARDMSIQDWYNVHNTLLQMDDSLKENKDLRNKQLEFELNGNGAYFFFPVLIAAFNEDDEFIENIMISGENQELWDTISTELSTENCEITVLPPQFINHCLINIDFSFQDIELTRAFNLYENDKSVEIAYSKVDGRENTYITLFYDGEEHALLSFYVFDTTGYDLDFVTILVEKCYNRNRTLLSLDPNISQDTINKWEKEDSVNLTEFLKNANEIDLKETINFLNVENPSINYPINQTLQ